MLEFASLEVASAPDFDYEDDDALAYNLIGAPSGTEARMLVGLQPFETDAGRGSLPSARGRCGQRPGRTDSGAVRYSPRVDLNIAYLESDPAVPIRLAVNVSRAVGFAASRDVGIDAYQGRHTEGAYFWIDLKADPLQPISGTYGVVDAVPRASRTSPASARWRATFGLILHASSSSSSDFSRTTQRQGASSDQDLSSRAGALRRRFKRSSSAAPARAPGCRRVRGPADDSL